VSLSRFFSERRLRLGGVDRETALLATGCLAGCGVLALVLLAEGFHVTIPGGSYTLAAVDEPVSRVLVVAAYLVLAVSAAALAGGATLPGWQRPRVTLLLVGLVGALLAVKSARAYGLLDTYRGIIPGHPLIPAWPLVLAVGLAWAGAAVALVVALAPSRLAERVGVVYPILAASPFVASLLVYAVAALESTRGPDLSRFGVHSAESGVAAGLTGLVANVGFWAAAAFLWQAALGARASLGVAGRIAKPASRSWKLVTSFIGLKVLWLAVGLAGILPAILGGGGTRWADARDNGVFAWVYVTLLAIGAGLWMVRRRHPQRSDGALAATAAVCAGLVVCLLAAAFFTLSADLVSGVWPGADVSRWFGDAAGWSLDRMILVQLVTVFGAGAIGVILWRTGRGTPGVRLFLVLFALWAWPRALSVGLGDIVGHPVSFGRVTPVTMDVALSVVGAVLMVLAIGRRVDVHPAIILAAILTSTLIAHTGWLLSSVASERAAFCLALVFAPAYQFLFASSRLNQDVPERPGRMLRATGLATAVMALITVQVATGFAGPRHEGIQSIGTLLIALPLAAVLVAAWKPSPRGAEPTGFQTANPSIGAAAAPVSGSAPAI
jgi:hypothetical protein